MNKMSIRELKERAGMTTAQLSEFSGIPVRTLENWLCGHRKPPDYVVQLLHYKIVAEGIVPHEERVY